MLNKFIAFSLGVILGGIFVAVYFDWALDWQSLKNEEIEVRPEITD